MSDRFVVTLTIEADSWEAAGILTDEIRAPNTPRLIHLETS